VHKLLNQNSKKLKDILLSFVPQLTNKSMDMYSPLLPSIHCLPLVVMDNCSKRIGGRMFAIISDYIN